VLGILASISRALAIMSAAMRLETPWKCLTLVQREVREKHGASVYGYTVTL
jgi:hypothetical protein